jgi:hypothetical protein
MTKTGYLRAHIAANATTTLIATSCFVSQISSVCSNAGSAWVVTVQDRDAPPRALALAQTQALSADGKPVIINWEKPILAVNGINIVAAGTTAGVVDIQIHYAQ